MLGTDRLICKVGRQTFDWGDVDNVRDSPYTRPYIGTGGRPAAELQF